MRFRDQAPGVLALWGLLAAAAWERSADPVHFDRALPRAHVASADPWAASAAATLTAARLVGAPAPMRTETAAVAALARSMDGSDGPAVMRGLWAAGAMPYSLEETSEGVPVALGTCACVSLLGWRPARQRAWNALVFAGTIEVGALVSDPRRAASAPLTRNDALAILGAADTWSVAACPREQTDACRDTLCAAGATGPACDGAPPDIELPPRTGYATTVRDAHVHIPEDNEDCGPSAAVVAARLLGLEVTEQEDEDAIAVMRREIGDLEGGTYLDHTAVGLWRMGANPFWIAAPTPAGLALSVDCGCPTILSYRNPGGTSRHAVLLARHSAGEDERWLESDNGLSEPQWQDREILERRIARGEALAVAVCPPALTPACERRLCEGTGLAEPCAVVRASAR